MNRKTLTVFTPTYNRLHTITKTYDSLCRQTCKDVEWLIIDDGSGDGLREWACSLGELIVDKGGGFDWMGLPTGEIDQDHFVIESGYLRIEYVYKPNGGLYTGYNVAFSVIETELCVCVDSDDFLPDNAVELIINKWKAIPDSDKPNLGGIAGLDYNIVDKKPIGGLFKTCSNTACVLELDHKGDCKFVFRTELIKRFAPQVGFRGEKDFNPHYMQMQLLDQYLMVVMNENLCWVDYQIGSDSMSQAIFRQYQRSPKSYVKYRLLELELKHNNNVINKYRLCSHYISSCIFSRDKNWFDNNPHKLLTVLSIPMGVLINVYIRLRNRY